MMQRSTLNRTELHSFFPVCSFFPAALAAGLTAALVLAYPMGVRAQDAAAAPADTAAAQSTPAAAKPDIALTNQKPAKKRKQAEPVDDKKAEKIVPSKDTKKVEKTVKRDNSLVGVDSNLPDKALYDKAEDAIKHGRFDVGRLDLQTLLNTYPESQFMMPAKLAIADSWYKEGGAAALTQAEQEYTDFITFFPNAPEAAEAQMRIGDIYFRQMDKPDRDNLDTVKAEAAYRQMLQQFPDSILVPVAKQQLRDVQEALASGEADVAGFYVTRSNMSAAIARYQTVVDTYPYYSHMDDVLIALGDAYESEAKTIRAMRVNPAASEADKARFEAGKARLVKTYDDQAIASFSKVVTEHSAAPHVEDARDRLAAMNVPIPKPTPEQAAASEALENSRGQYTLSKRATLLFMHQADTVPAATVGDPPLVDAPPTLAPTIYRQSMTGYMDAMNGTVHSGTPLPAEVGTGRRERSCPGGHCAVARGRAHCQRSYAGNEFVWRRRVEDGHRDRPADAWSRGADGARDTPCLPRHRYTDRCGRGTRCYSCRRRHGRYRSGWPDQCNCVAAGGKTRSCAQPHQRRHPGIAAARAGPACQRQESQGAV